MIFVNDICYRNGNSALAPPPKGQGKQCPLQPILTIVKIAIIKGLTGHRHLAKMVTH